MFLLFVKPALVDMELTYFVSEPELRAQEQTAQDWRCHPTKLSDIECRTQVTLSK